MALRPSPWNLQLPSMGSVWCATSYWHTGKLYKFARVLRMWEQKVDWQWSTASNFLFAQKFGGEQSREIIVIDRQISHLTHDVHYNLIPDNIMNMFNKLTFVIVTGPDLSPIRNVLYSKQELKTWKNLSQCLVTKPRIVSHCL